MRGRSPDTEVAMLKFSTLPKVMQIVRGKFRKGRGRRLKVYCETR